MTAVTGVDYAPDKMEVVYHAYRTTGGPGLVFKVQVPRVDPVEVRRSFTSTPGGFSGAKPGICSASNSRVTICAILMWEALKVTLPKIGREAFYEEDTKTFQEPLA
jgi:NADH-quinone oxidoreductase subunit D/NADH-quinone oxidoreductase subunit C/D